VVGSSSRISLVPCCTRCPSCFLYLIDDCVEVLPEHRECSGLSTVVSAGAGSIFDRCSSGKARSGVDEGLAFSENLFYGKATSLTVGGLICLFRSWSISG